MFETDTTKDQRPKTSRDISQAGTGLQKQIKHNNQHFFIMSGVKKIKKLHFQMHWTQV